MRRATNDRAASPSRCGNKNASDAMKLLFTTPTLGHPPSGGPQLRIETSIKALSQVCELDVISRTPNGGVGKEYYRDFCHEFHVAPSARTVSPNRYIRKLQQIMGGFGGRDVRADADFILAHVERRGIDTIWFGFGNISYPLIAHLKQRRPDLKMVCDTDSVWSRFILRRLPYVTGLRRWAVARAGARKEREERAWVALCEITTAVSEIDAQYYRSLTADPGRVHVFSNVIDIDVYGGEKPPPPPGFHHPAIYLAGNFGHYHSPMDTAARWTIEDILPKVRDEIPNVHFYLVGDGSDRMFGHLTDPGITVTGRLPSVLPYLRNVDVSLVPLKFESGTRFKILEAGICGVPVVSTTLGAEGIPVVNGKDILIADEPADFAAAIVQLLRDKTLANDIAAGCQALVRQRYSVESLSREARKILAALAGTGYQQIPS
jgi:glycosyltransferase involved in cell wall biosynthesis